MPVFRPAATLKCVKICSMNASDIDNEINRSRSLSEICRAERLRVFVEVLRTLYRCT